MNESKRADIKRAAAIRDLETTVRMNQQAIIALAQAQKIFNDLGDDALASECAVLISTTKRAVESAGQELRSLGYR